MESVHIISLIIHFVCFLGETIYRLILQELTKYERMHSNLQCLKPIVLLMVVSICNMFEIKSKWTQPQAEKAAITVARGIS